ALSARFSGGPVGGSSSSPPRPKRFADGRDQSALWGTCVAARLFLGLTDLGLDVRVGLQLVNCRTELRPAGHSRLQVREGNAEILRRVQGRRTFLNVPEPCTRRRI